MNRNRQHLADKKSLLGTTSLMLLLLFCQFSVAEEDEGHRLYEAACTQCHGLKQIEVTRNGRAGWEDTVHKMIVTGAQLSVEEMELVIDYLYKQHGPNTSDPMRTGVLPFDSPLSNGRPMSSESVVLPDGEGKLLIEAYCMMCHDLGRVVATRRGRQEWRSYVKDMLRRNSMIVSDEQFSTMLAYLNQHFGK